MKTFRNLSSDINEAKKMKGEDPCWTGYEMIGKKQKNGKEVPNCVPVKEGAVPSTEKTVTVRHQDSGKELVVIASKAAEYAKQGYHQVKEAKEAGDDICNDGTPAELKKKGSKTMVFPTDMKEAKDEKEYGYEGDMAINQLKTIMRHAEYLIDMMKPDTDLPEWVQSKITLAADYIQTSCDYLTSEMNEETSWSKTGKEATHRETGEKTYEYHEVNKEGKPTGKREYRNAQGKPMGEEFAGWVAHYNGQKHEIQKHQAKDLYDAKKKAIEHFKVPKHKQGLLAIKPGYNESIEEGTDIKSMPTDKLKKHWDTHKDQTGASPVFAAQLKRVGKELSKRKALNKEEVEQIDEISRGLADRYLSKVAQQQVKKHGMKPNLYDKLPVNRQHGVVRAFDRVLVKRPVKEETVEIEEQHADEGKFKPTVPQNVRPTAGVTPREKFTQKVVREDTLDEGKMGELHADLSDHLDKHIANYKKVGGAEHFGHKTTQVASKIAKLHGIQQHHAQKFVNDYVENKLKEEKENVPFDPPYKKVKGTGTVTDKSGAKHTPMSRARDLARAALKRQQEKKVNEQSNIQPNPFTIKSEDPGKPPSRKAQIVRDVLKRGKKSDDKFQSEPVLANTVDKSAN